MGKVEGGWRLGVGGWEGVGGWPTFKKRIHFIATRSLTDITPEK